MTKEVFYYVLYNQVWSKGRVVSSVFDLCFCWGRFYHISSRGLLISHRRQPGEPQDSEDCPCWNDVSCWISSWEYNLCSSLWVSKICRLLSFNSYFECIISPQSILNNYPSPGRRPGLGYEKFEKRDRVHNACVEQRGSNSCGLSGGLLTPPSCLNHFSWNFLGMFGDILAVHISKISLIHECM